MFHFRFLSLPLIGFGMDGENAEICHLGGERVETVDFDPKTECHYLQQIPIEFR